MISPLLNLLWRGGSSGESQGNSDVWILWPRAQSGHGGAVMNSPDMSRKRWKRRTGGCPVKQETRWNKMKGKNVHFQSEFTFRWTFSEILSVLKPRGFSNFELSGELQKTVVSTFLSWCSCFPLSMSGRTSLHAVHVTLVSFCQSLITREGSTLACIAHRWSPRQLKQCVRLKSTMRYQSLKNQEIVN